MVFSDNPFKILDVYPTDSRRVIIAHAEEKSLLLDAHVCTDARTILTNPQRRIAAEVHWFLDCSPETIRDIVSYINETISNHENDGQSWGSTNPLTQLNIQLACLSAQDFNDISKTKYRILGFSRLFEAIEVDSVLELINKSRQIAGFPEVSRAQDVDTALNDLRSEIRRELSQMLQKLPERTYIQIVTLLSEAYSGNPRYKGNAVLEDVIGEYQLYINDTLHRQGQSIIKAAKFIAQGANKIRVSAAVKDLIDRLYAWDCLAQPLQLGALTKGSSHAESVEMLEALRQLALKLHNEYGLSSESLTITQATQEVFRELPEYKDMLTEDNQILTRLVEEKESEEILGPILEQVNKAYDQAKEHANYNCMYSLITQIRRANDQIVTQGTSNYDPNKLRSTLAALVRSYALELHNDLERSKDALFLLESVESTFRDLPDISSEICEDIAALRKLIQEKEATDKIIAGLKELDGLARSATLTASIDREKRISSLLSKAVDLDELIKKYIEDQTLRNQCREKIASVLRSVGIELHNSKQDSESALRVITAAKQQFSDLPSVSNIFIKDINTLRNEIYLKEQQTKKKHRRTIIGLVAVLALIVYFVVDASNSTNATPKATVKPYVYATPKPTPTLISEPMPANGHVFSVSTTYRPSSFKVTNSGSSNYYMKFVKAGTNTPVIKFFVRSFSTVEIDMPEGSLELRYAYGSTWYGEDDLFGTGTRYARDEDLYDFTNYSWEISLYTTQNTGMSMDVENISAAEF